MSERAGHFHAKLVQRQGQRAALTFATAPQISWTLHRLYPLLLIIDGFLSNVMWCCEDVCLPFIHLVLMILSVNLFKYQAGVPLIQNLFESWLGLMSCVLLVLSMVYYISSVVRELKTDEPPTLDDIVMIMETVIYKLEIIRRDVSGGLKLDQWKVIPLLVIITPVYWFMAQYLFTSRDYVIFLILLCSVYHSTWFQCTLRLLWRSLYVRQLLSFLTDHSKASSPDIANFYTVINKELEVSIPSSLCDLPWPQLANSLRRAINGVHISEQASEESVTSYRVKLVEFGINENQRKWPLDGWKSNLLPYERSKFSATRDFSCLKCSSPWELQESLGKDWIWLDDAWKPSSWIYGDTNWDIKGEFDSLNCYTRERTWKRRAGQIT